MTLHLRAAGILFLIISSVCAAAAQPGANLPERLTDEQFWALSTASSEEDGYFRSDNLLSNETTFQWIIPDLLKTAQPGRVYVGVGPEQNFTYIAALKPKMVFIVDIRHGNLDVHLMYKALFEMSEDRVDFVSRLFSRKKPEGLAVDAPVTEIFKAIAAASGSNELYQANLMAIEEHLSVKHGFPLTQGDREGIAWALSNFYQFGPYISYNSSLSANVPPSIVGATSGFGGGFRGGNNYVDYGDLMVADDNRGQFRSYLASDENFRFLKDLHSRNLLVPVVGDFGGSKALRAVAAYVKDANAMLSAFYLSNVEQYLAQDGKWDRFCLNVAAFPLDETSIFIRSGRGSPYTGIGGGAGVQNSWFAPILQDIAVCMPAK
jgi:hypothetical protein